MQNGFDIGGREQIREAWGHSVVIIHNHDLLSPPGLPICADLLHRRGPDEGLLCLGDHDPRAGIVSAADKGEVCLGTAGVRVDDDNGGFAPPAAARGGRRGRVAAVVRPAAPVAEAADAEQEQKQDAEEDAQHDAAHGAGREAAVVVLVDHDDARGTGGGHGGHEARGCGRTPRGSGGRRLIVAVAFRRRRVTGDEPGGVTRPHGLTARRRDPSFLAGGACVTDPLSRPIGPRSSQLYHRHLEVCCGRLFLVQAKICAEGGSKGPAL